MFTTRPELHGTFGMVASTHYLSSQAGMAVLERGGNAFDAVVASAFVMHIVEPHLNGPGGDAPVIFHKPGDEPVVLCGQGPAPAGATIEHYTSQGLTTIPGTGQLAPAVPGAVVMWLTLLRDHGTMRLRDVLSYAVDYAGNGHPLISAAGAVAGTMVEFFQEHWPESAAQWLNADGTPPRPMQMWRNVAWARTLERLISEGEARGEDRSAQCDGAIEAWSNGFVAEAIEEFLKTPRRDSSGEDHAGVMTAHDLATWQPAYEHPASYEFRGKRVFKCGPWSQGPVLLESLAILDGLLPERLGDWDSQTVHNVIETVKLVMADREAYFGDSGDDLLHVPDLLDPAFIDGRRSLIGDEASLEIRPGSLGGRTPKFAQAIREKRDGEVHVGVGEPTVRRDGLTRGDTSHIDVIDRWGNVISATPSGGWLHSSPYIPEVGFCLGTRLQMNWLEEGLPTSLQPGRRPRTTLTPSMSIDQQTGRVMAFGTPGGDQQDQWQLSFLIGHWLRGLNMQEAIDSPAWHTESFVSSFDPRVWQPGAVVIEDRFDPQLLDELRGRGHLLTLPGDWKLGRTSAASYDPEERVLRAAANARGMQGYAVGR